MDSYKVSFRVSLGNGYNDPEREIEILSDQLEMQFHVEEKDMNAFTRVLRKNGVPHTILPNDPADMSPEDHHITYNGGEDDEEDGNY